MSNDIRIRDRLRLRPGIALVHSIILIGVLLVAAICSVAGWTIKQSRDKALDNAGRELNNTALLFARHFERAFEELAADQSRVAAVLQPTADLSSQWVHELLTKEAGEIGTFYVFDSTGRLTNFSRDLPVPSVHLGNDDKFQRWVSEGSSHGNNVELIRDPVHGGWSLALLSSLRDRQGRTAGVLARVVPTIWYEDFASSIVQGETGAISMFLADGTLVARAPKFTPGIGQIVQSQETKPLFESNHSVVQLHSPFDGSVRLASSSKLTNQPFVIVASQSIEAILSDWRREIGIIVSVGIASALAVAFVLFQLGKQLMRQRAELHERYSVSVNNMSHGLTLFDSAGRLLLFNRRYLELYEFKPGEVQTGMTADDLFKLLRKRARDSSAVDKYRLFVANNASARNSYEVETDQGHAVLITREPIAGGGWVTTHEEISERKRASSRIHYLAHYDELTGLPNRSSFRNHLEQVLARLGPHRELALLYIDIDEFKSVNDTLGHPVGDLLLKALAERLKSCLGPSDYVARLGGDEFAVIKDDASTARNVAEMIHRTLRDTYDCDGHAISTDVSIGIALAPHHAQDVNELIAKADLALYAAKAGGRRTYRFFKPEMDVKAKARHQLANELRRAVADRAFRLYFQPLIELGSDNVTGCEALLRWKHPVRGYISPAEFVPLAEEIGLIEELGDWVLDEACRVAAGWPAHMSVAVNVSPIQFRRQTFPLKVASALARSGLSAHRLELEITEALLLHDDELTLSALRELRSMGLRIALDDFGTGYSSLSYLHRFPIDKIKIDKSFVDTVTKEGGSSTIIQAIVQIAASDNKVTLAEGVETAEQRELLAQLGCQQMQGYLFSPAIPSDALSDLIGNPDQAATG